MGEKLTVDNFYAEGLKGKLLGLQCESGHVTVPPKSSCRVCTSQDLRIAQLSGIGKIVSFTDVYSKSKEFPIEVPYTLALVTLEEGGNLLGIIEKTRTTIRRDLGVSISFRKLENGGKQGWPRIFFSPINSS